VPGLPDAVWFEQRGDNRSVDHCMEAFLCFRRRGVADGHEQSAVIEAVDPFKRGVLDGFKRSPGGRAEG
jgi:hypothetical protein